MDLDGKKIILTGASSGIGKNILEKLKDYNVRIIAVSRNIGTISAYGDKVIPFACDISKKEAIDKLFDFAVKTLGEIDIFIANAGFAYCEYIKNADWDHMQEIFNTNVFSPIYSTEKMKEINGNRKYTVVITCSAVSEVPLPGYSLYCSTKHAINGFGRVYSYELKKRELISLVYPIATNTHFFKTAGEKSPIPWPVQSPQKVASCIIKGIIKERRFIYPSKAFIVVSIINRILPFLYPAYVKIQANKFNKWIEGYQHNHLAK